MLEVEIQLVIFLDRRRCFGTVQMIGVMFRHYRGSLVDKYPFFWNRIMQIIMKRSIK